MFTWVKRIQGSFQDAIHTERSAHSIAIGFSIGSFISILPLFGLSIPLGVLLAILWKHSNKLAIFIALAVWNPVTLVPIYLLSFYIGDVFFGGLPIVEYELDLIYRVFHLTRRMLVGNTILGMLIAALSYPVVKTMVQWYRGVQ